MRETRFGKRFFGFIEKLLTWPRRAILSRGRATLCGSARRQGENGMKKLVILLMVFCFIFAGKALADEEDYSDELVVIEDAKLPYELNTWLVKTVCVEGHVFLISYVLGRQAGAGVHATQVYEEKEGKNVPMRCDGKSIKKRPKKQQEEQ